jgi:hypothetical protein
METVSPRQQTFFFVAIVFFFAMGIALLVYKNYSEYYQQQIATSNEISSTPVVPHQTVVPNKN